MRIKQLSIFFFALLGTIFFFVCDLFFFTSSQSSALNTSLPKPNIKIEDQNRYIKLNNKSKFHSIQYVDFSSSNQDTGMIDPGKLVFLPINRNWWMAKMPCALKQQPPTLKCIEAHALAVRCVDERNNAYGSWYYYTATRRKHSLPIISIFINATDLMGFERGIYTTGISQLLENNSSINSRAWWLGEGNWKRKGKEWEREIVFQYLNQNSRQLFKTTCGIRIHGNATRGFPQKSFRLISDKRYSNDYFNFRFFSTETKNKNLILRNSGNDWGHTMFADAFIQSLIPENWLDKQQHEPVTLYLNGQYWGVYTLTHRIDKHHLASKYKTKPKNVTILEGDALDEGELEVAQQFFNFISYSKQKINHPSEWFNRFDSLVDSENFISFLAMQLYIANADLLNPNCKVYKIKNGKWRCIVKDLDCAYSYSSNNAYLTNMFVEMTNTNSVFGIILKAGLQSKKFKLMLKKKLLQYISGPFEIQRQLKKLNYFKSIFEKEIQYQIERWRKPYTKETWLTAISNVKEFILKRKYVVLAQIKNYLE